MAYTTTQRDALQAAIASGVLTVTFQGRSVTYQSLEAMRTVLGDMNRELAGTTGRTFRLGVTSKMGHGVEDPDE